MPQARDLVSASTFAVLCTVRERMHEAWAEPLRVSELAELAGLSRAHFIRTFAQAFGKTPHQYLMALRLERAKAILRHGGDVTEACFETGFSSLGSFSAGFSRQVGRSPSAYRAEMRCLLQVPGAVQRAFVPLCFLKHFSG